MSERLIRTIAAIRSFPHDNVEDLIRKVRVPARQSPLRVVSYTNVIVSYVYQRELT